MEIKISVLASGKILLNGEPASLSTIQDLLRKADPKADVVLYYRENAQGKPAPESLELMKLIVSQKLPVSLSSKPDFSDYVDQFGKSYPRSKDAGQQPAQASELRMPDVELGRNAEEIFEQARKSGAGQKQAGAVVIVRPDRGLLVLPPPPPSPATAKLSEQLATIIPAGRSCNIAAISDTSFATSQTGGVPGIEAAARAIPFFGFLIGWAQAGHRVCVFEGHPSALAAGLKESEYLLLDSATLPLLQPDWMAVAKQSMQPGGRVFLHDRGKYQLQLLAATNKPPGWRISEPDGEASYAKCLLTTMAKGSTLSVELVPGSAVPDLAALGTNPDDLEWIAGLPFRYELLDAEKVIAVLLNAVSKGNVDPSQKEWVLTTKVVSKTEAPRIQKFVLRREQKWFKTILHISKA